MKKHIIFLFAVISSSMFSQQIPTSSETIQNGLNLKAEMTRNSLVKNLPFKNIGPTVMSGRVVDFAVNSKNPTEFYVGYASGGVWYTNNNGTTYTPVLDNAPTQDVGCVAADWENGTIWVGTGEVNASRSSYAGIGILKSEDHGKTWKNMGLEGTQHISSILINPDNPDEIVVGALGNLYSKNKERGVFKSSDGGKSWNKTLFVNDSTGVIEVSVNPHNFKEMYASAWEKDRKAWNFKGSGEGSAIYKSTNAGETWNIITTRDSGFPSGDEVGRIGVAVIDANNLYAIVDNQAHRKKEKKSEEEKDELEKDSFEKMSSKDFLALDDKKLEKFLRQNGFQEKYKAESVKTMVREKEISPADLAKYLKNANTELFDTPVIGAEVYKSTNGGKSWKKTHEGFLDDIYYSYGYYFGKIHVAPQNSEEIYIYGVPILKSLDGGKTFTSIDADNVHSDHHALWVDPNLPGHLIDGNDGGVNISYDDGETWIKSNAPSVGQFYFVTVDNEKPYNVYGGLQDNGTWVGPHDNEENVRWHSNGNYPFKSLTGGDGMQVQVDNRNSNIVYSGFQFGNYFRTNRETGKQTYIMPKHELGENPYRFNWQTPILLSPHNQDVLYYGGNKLMRSMNQGDDWQAISPDLTQGPKKGNVAYGTLSAVSESPFQFGLLYTGSDDGLVYVSKDAGSEWQKISESLPQDLWVSRVVASAHKKERVYVSLNGYRYDDFQPYVYVSENYGQDWKDISSNLPPSPVNVIKEDPANENILYLGTDNGAYVSFNQGDSWQAFAEGLPNVAVHDLAIQARDKDLVVGTHGRSIYIADISLIEKLKPSKMNEILISKVESLRSSSRWGSKFSQWGEVYEPEVNLQIFTPEMGKATVSIKTEDGNELKEITFDASKGINMVKYDATVSEKGKDLLSKENKKLKKAENGNYYLPEGKYKIVVKQASKSAETELEIKGGGQSQSSEEEIEID